MHLCIISRCPHLIQNQAHCYGKQVFLARGLLVRHTPSFTHVAYIIFLFCTCYTCRSSSYCAMAHAMVIMTTLFGSLNFITGSVSLHVEKICFITNLLLTLLLAVDVRRDLLAVASLWHSVFMLSSASGQLIRVLGKVCI